MFDNNFLMNTYKRLPVTFEKGEGAYLYDENGKKYLDFVSGLGVVGLGHSNKEIADAVCDQSKKLVHVSNLYSTKPQQMLAKKLSEISLGGKVFFANSGAEANEAAIKLARKYGKKKLNGAFEIITASNSFHGRTLATLAATAQPEKQQSFTPMPEGFKYAEFNNFEKIERAVDENTCAVMLETIQGEGGVNVAKLDYLNKVENLCKQKEVLLIIDEVQTGIGRTGDWFSYKHFGIKPNAITMAKGLANGLPIGALVGDELVSDIFEPGDHASTFGGGRWFARRL
jgi:predicted acetylornithine/succinylornithine family transaminase